MVLPASSRRHKGVIVLEQLKHAMAMQSSSSLAGAGTGLVVSSALITTRLLNAGQPLHAVAPPVPLQRPSPLHEPSSSGRIATVLGRRFKFTGR